MLEINVTGVGDALLREERCEGKILSHSLLFDSLSVQKFWLQTWTFFLLWDSVCKVIFGVMARTKPNQNSKSHGSRHPHSPSAWHPERQRTLRGSRDVSPVIPHRVSTKGCNYISIPAPNGQTHGRHHSFIFSRSLGRNKRTRITDFERLLVFTTISFIISLLLCDPPL